MPSKYLNDARTGELIQKIYTADRAIATECKSYTDTNYLPLTGGTITGNLTVSGTITGDVTGDLTGNADSATNDANGNPITSTYLPRTGGTMTGNVVVKTNSDKNRIQIAGGNTSDGYSGGARLSLYGKTASGDNAGGFALMAYDDTDGRKNLIGKPDGTLTWDGNDITPQKYSAATTSSDVSVPNATIKNLMTFTLSKGTWVVQVIATFPANATGYRMYGISNGTTPTYLNRFYGVNVQATSGNPTIVPFTTIISVSSNTTFYLNAYHTAGTTLNVGGGYRVFRVSSIN